jgi:hypothetical protein
MSAKRKPQRNYPTKFHVELWTTIYGSDSSREMWAVVMDDGDDTGHGCAFGARTVMQQWADKLNACGGVLSAPPEQVRAELAQA